jgi:threonine/homoserine/homoserine lactone efflux protein
MSVPFLLTSLVIVVSPGTGALFTIAAGLAGGRRRSIIAALGCTLGIVPHMVAAIVGLAALLYTSAVAFQALKFVGVAYLLVMAVRTLREDGPLTFEPKQDIRTPRQVIVSAVLVNVLNPKLSIFFFAFLPQFVKPGESGRIGHMLGLSLVFMLLTFVVFLGYGLFASWVRSHVISRPRVLVWMRRVFASAFIALGAKLAFAER